MPLDNSFDTVQINWRLLRVTKWKLRLCWRPETCSLTGMKLWGKQAYYGEYYGGYVTYPDMDPDMEHYWIERNEFIIWQLKK